MADAAVELASVEGGLTADEWQRRVLRTWFATVPAAAFSDGWAWACSSAGLAVPRQNGKNAVLEIFELYSMVILGRRILHTAHEVKTARKHFKRLASFFDKDLGAPPVFADMVTELRYANGEQGIFLSNGGSLELAARSKGSGRGFTVDTLVIDEAQQYGDDEQEALKPTISSAPSGKPQTIYTGTPPSPKMTGDVFVRMRESALAGGGRLGWDEWAHNEDVDTSDPAVAARVNPAYGIRLNPEVVEDERTQFSEEGYYRERLGRWYDYGGSATFDMGVWAGMAIPASDAPAGGVGAGLLSFGIDVNADRTMVTVVAAIKPVDGPIYVEVVDQRSMVDGLGWVVDLMAARWSDACAVVVDGRSPAATLLTDLAGVKVRPMVTSAADMQRACGRWMDLFNTGGLSHMDQRQLGLALSAAMKRFSGDAMAFSWDRKNLDCDVSALVAATLAVWGVETSKRRPGRKARVSF